mgnify:CR=1 FL=1
MASESSQDLDSLAIEFLKLVNDIIPWRDLSSEIRQDKWRILAKRVMASSGDDIQEFLHNIIKSIAGDSFYVTRSERKKKKEKGGEEKEGEEKEGEERRRLGKELEEYLKKVKSIGKEKELIDYIKSRAIPLIIRLSAEEGET